MPLEEGLWEKSAAWRWTTAITLLLSGLAFLLSPWRTQSTGTPPLATYQPQTIINKKNSGVVSASGISSSTANIAVSGKNPAFDVSLPLIKSPLPAGTELHMIGVYQGTAPDLQKEPPWWTKCNVHRNDSASMSECHAKYANQRTMKPVNVDVHRSSTPMVLVLMSYDPVLWKLHINPQSKIQKIILSGYSGQDIEGAPNDVPVEARTREPSPCRNCSRQGDFFWAYSKESKEYDLAAKKLQAITGISPTSFQGSQQGSRFLISDSTITPLSKTSDTNNDSFIGKNFKDQIFIAGESISLPNGIWRVLAFNELPSKRGSDKLIALGKFEENRVTETISIRLQTISDLSGFPSFSGCKTTPNYTAKITSNEPFGLQLCYEVVHVTDAWRQAFLSSVATAIQKQGISVPEIVIASSYHKATLKTSVDFLHYLIPESTLVTRNESWASSNWHPNNIDKSSERWQIIQEIKKSTATWYQIFSLSE